MKFTSIFITASAENIRAVLKLMTSGGFAGKEENGNNNLKLLQPKIKGKMNSKPSELLSILSLSIHSLLYRTDVKI